MPSTVHLDDRFGASAHSVVKPQVEAFLFSPMDDDSSTDGAHWLLGEETSPLDGRVRHPKRGLAAEGIGRVHRSGEVTAWGRS